MKLFIFSLFMIGIMAGGMPGLHGLEGRYFGSAVSGLAQSYPGAVADHMMDM